MIASLEARENTVRRNEAHIIEREQALQDEAHLLEEAPPAIIIQGSLEKEDQFSPVASPRTQRNSPNVMAWKVRPLIHSKL
jgi:hypothetical protein